MIEIPQLSVDDVLRALKPYQAEQLAAAIGNGTDEELIAAASTWIGASGPGSTIPFGGIPDKKPFFDSFMAELEGFLCGTSPGYEDERKEVKKILSLGGSKTNLVTGAAGYIAGAVAMKLGVAAALLTPAIALVLVVIGKLGIRAWCRSRGCAVQ